LTEILGRMDTMQKAITARTTSPGQKTSGMVRSRTNQVNALRTRAAKATK